MLYMSDKRKGNAIREYQNIEETLIRKLASILITEHRINNNHEFNWDNPDILDKEKYYYKRLISEMINIKSQKNALNIQSDTELLQQTYVKILNKI